MHRQQLVSAAIGPTTTDLSIHCRHSMFKTPPFTPPHNKMTTDNTLLAYDVFKAFAIKTGARTQDQGSSKYDTHGLTKHTFISTLILALQHIGNHLHRNHGQLQAVQLDQRLDFHATCGHPKLRLHQHWDNHQDMQLQKSNKYDDEDIASTQLYHRQLLTPYPSRTDRQSKYHQGKDIQRPRSHNGRNQNSLHQQRRHHRHR